MQISPFGLDAIMAYEGFFARPYRCPAGVLTQGFGHTARAGGERLGGVWSRSHAADVLRADLRRQFEPGVSALLVAPATQGQYDAMVSFAYNCGIAALAGSSILKFHNRGEPERAAAAFGLWCRAGGKTLPGLVRRRATEALMYAGVQDANFDGRRAPDEPLYGVMPRRVEPARERIAASGTAHGAGVAGAGAAAVVASQVSEVVDQITAAEGHISAGTWAGLVVGILIIGGVGYALYCRWRDAGRPLPWATEAER